eukprot:CAMPEP_0181343074 /NCGR_PEP_ID=MMETSP1101-20121128/31384_1 /TAXON_ID=46948 /ORGANISM="Rhodomonas abbreviata, Strain Caron Lab Isolate" /LENGTH=81 /DNA_ID=CAMNT_0023454663 /DNA_START=34 /DNA_END=275 /DNA_ORIENTATION=-
MGVVALAAEEALSAISDATVVVGPSLLRLLLALLLILALLVLALCVISSSRSVGGVVARTCCSLSSLGKGSGLLSLHPAIP